MVPALVAAAVVANGGSIGCGGATAIDDSSGGSAGGASGGTSSGTGGAAASGGGIAATGGRPAATGGSKASGGIAGTGGRSTSRSCPAADPAVNNWCPPTLEDALAKFGFNCERPNIQDGCVVEEENCGLVAARIVGGPVSQTCQYDARYGGLVGATFTGKAFGCASYSGTFPPEGFTQGKCGIGSFDSPHE